MPASPEHLSALRAYEMLWHIDATDADIRAAFAPGFQEHRPGADGSGVTEFRAHRQAAFDALTGLSARYAPIAGDGQRLPRTSRSPGCSRPRSKIKEGAARLWAEEKSPKFSLPGDEPCAR
jgi:hypothetical protein